MKCGLFEQGHFKPTGVCVQIEKVITEACCSNMISRCLCMKDELGKVMRCCEQEELSVAFAI